MIYTATTPSDTFTLPIETNTCTKIQVTYKQGKYKIVKLYQNGTLPPGMTLDGKKIIVRLTQDETKKFNSDGMISVQVRVKTESNDVFASQKWKVYVDTSLNEEVL